MGRTMNESRDSNIRRLANLTIGNIKTRSVPKFAITVACALLCAAFTCPANAQVNGVGQLPYLGLEHLQRADDRALQHRDE